MTTPIENVCNDVLKAFGEKNQGSDKIASDKTHLGANMKDETAKQFVKMAAEIRELVKPVQVTYQDIDLYMSGVL